MGKVNEIKVPIPAGCKATTEIKDGIMTVLIEKEKVKKEWMLELNRKYYYIDHESCIENITIDEEAERTHPFNENLFRHESDAKAMLAYIKLLDMYYKAVGDYVPDWMIDTSKYCIFNTQKYGIRIDQYYSRNHVFAFSTLEQAQQFLTDYSELIEQAKRFL